jgi:mono/diheme cytochrome c family protein
MRTSPLHILGCFGVLLAQVLAPEKSFSQAYGLTTRPNVAAYFDGKLPLQPPTVPTNWSTVVAFPNLTFLNPVGLVPMPGTSKLVVWEREGRVYSFDNNPTASTKTLVLDVSSVCQGWDDSGLLGLAFHPNFQTNRYVFIWYNHTRPGVAVMGNANTRPNSGQDTVNRLSRFTLDANGVAVPGSETVFIDQNDTSVWHNGGGMFFHPQNGFLYITNGDDTVGSHNGRIDGGLFSGVLRIDVDKRGGTISHPPTKRALNEVSPNWPQYYIPNDNPFVGVPDALEEFFSIALRSPHRMTIDPPTGRIFIGDVGQGSREEISVIEPNDAPGLNFQWDDIEGYNGDLTGSYIGVNKRPIIDYTRSDGAAVIGGFVYRGSAFPELIGKYIFGDNISNRIWVLDESTHTATTPANKILIATLPKGPGPNAGNDYVGLSSFGYDANGELYMCQLSSTAGKIYKLQRGGPAPGTPLPAKLSDLGVFTNLANLTPSPKLIPYALNSPFWSDSAIKFRWAAIPNSTAVGFAPTGEWTFPEGTVMVKHFELNTDDTNPTVRRRLETRFLVQMASGAVYGATYKWRADNSDADLLDNALTENVPITIPSMGALTGVDIGSPALAGSTNRAGEQVTIVAGGSDIWNNSDQFHFAHQQRTGDFDVMVRGESLNQANLYTKAGLMARESLAANSRHVYALLFPSNAARNNNTGGYEFQYRSATGGASTAIYPAAPQPLVNYPNSWLRLRRTGDTFIAYWSPEGAAWTEFARTTLALPPTVYFGLAVTSHTTTATTTARFVLQNTRLQPWYYPSRSDCVTCHTQQAGGFLGTKTRQLNRDLLYPNGVTDNQIRSWNHIGLFNSAPQESDIPTFDTLAPLTDTTASLEKRARSYFDSNCAQCHRPGGAHTFWDARYDTPLPQQGIVYGNVTSDLGITGAKVVVPQDLARSILHQRLNRVGMDQMPPLARNQIDTAGVATIAAWINSLTPNTPPIAAITAPLAGSTFMRPTVRLAATANDADGIMKVDFYNGPALVGSASSPPYEFLWQRAPRGPLNISAIAYDGIGNSAQTPGVTVNTQDPATTFQAYINFQPASAAIPNGYLEDDGALYGNRGNGLTYGWNFDCAGSARDRNLAADQRYDTLIHMQKDGNDVPRTNIWEIAVPNGLYDVRVVVGDQSYAQGRQQVTAEGVIAVDGVQSTGNMFFDNTVTVMVSDGKLTLAPGPQADTCRICFTEITRVPIPPTVALNGLSAGSTFLSSDNLTLIANAFDLDGSIVRVEFWDGNVKLGEATTAPYAWTWNGPLSLGNHNISAIAYDNEGRITNSTVVAVNVMPLQLTLTGATGSPPLMNLHFQTQLPAGRAYEIEWSEDFVTWHNLQSGVSTGQVLNVQAGTSNATNRFYRLRVLGQ